ncbi:hypothetical protein VKT23_018925 [Stygiomarasmius scandens]|uniref:DUF6593 domain-containing protein n=1 Tax=Marasmiellus scandens TaxID=2682957 RepID=A0ABR1IMZ3_9AGAR
MKLFQKDWSYNAILNNTYYDESSRIVYKVHTPNVFIGGTTTITKFLSSAEDPSLAIIETELEQPDKDFTSDEEYEQSLRANGTTGSELVPMNNEASGSRISLVGDEPISPSDVQFQSPLPSPGLRAGSDANHQFVYIAQIDWKVLKSSRLRFDFGDGKEVLAKDFFRKETWGPYGRHRVFKGSDGADYKWILGTFTPELIKDDSSKTPIAKFHRRDLGILSKSKKSPAYLEIYAEGEHIVDEIFSTFVYIERLRKKKERAARAP